MGLSKTRRANRYSLILLRAAFIHRDYMHKYMTYLPTTSIFQTVATNFNCEDLAMSLFVTYLRNGTKPHYLADVWAISSMVKLYAPAGGISLTGGHKPIRHQCVTNFTKELGLFSGSTHELPSYPLFSPSTTKEQQHHLGAPLLALDTTAKPQQRVPCAREVALSNYIRNNFTDTLHNNVLLWEWQIPTIWEAMKSGLIPNTGPWEERWHRSSKKSDLLTQEEYWMVATYFHNASFLSEEQIRFVQKIILQKKLANTKQMNKKQYKKEKKKKN